MSAELWSSSAALNIGVYLSKIWHFLTAGEPQPQLIFKCDSRCIVDSVNIHSCTVPQDRGLVLSLADLREVKKANNIKVQHVSSEANLADELTKPLPCSKF